jgi:hypothetical protein
MRYNYGEKKNDPPQMTERTSTRIHS